MLGKFIRFMELGAGRWTLAAWLVGGSVLLPVRQSNADPPRTVIQPKTRLHPPKENATAPRKDAAGRTASPLPMTPARTTKRSMGGDVLYQRLLKSIAWVVAAPPDKEGISWGTAWVLDAKERLLVTNQHVVCDGAIPYRDGDFRVYFPEYRKGTLLTDRQDRLARGSFTTARLIDLDDVRDLALLQVERLPDDARPIRLANRSAGPGATVHSVGNPGVSDALWVYSSGTVRQVYRAKEVFPHATYEYLRVESQSPTNQGDSGGPVVNDQGELVAVNHGSLLTGRLMTWFIDVSEVRTFMEDARRYLNPTTAEAFELRGRHSLDHGRVEAAIEDLTEAIRLEPKRASAYASRGWAFSAKEDYQTALTDFAEAIELESQDADHYRGRGETHASLGDKALALADFTEAIRRQPQDATLYNARADVYFGDEEYDKAIADYTRAAELDPEEGDYWNSRGVSLAAQEKYSEAIEAYGEALKRQPKMGVYYYNRASAYHELHDEPNMLLDCYRMEAADPSYAQTQRQKLTRRYLKITNAAQERLQVWVKYHTFTDEGNWEWFPEAPDDGRWAITSFEPGESKFIIHDGFLVNADRVRLWAGNASEEEGWQKSTRVWAQYEKQDLRLLPEEGEEGYFLRTFEFRLE